MTPQEPARADRTSPVQAARCRAKPLLRTRRWHLSQAVTGKSVSRRSSACANIPPPTHPSQNQHAKGSAGESHPPRASCLPGACAARAVGGFRLPWPITASRALK